ncbi:MAG: serine hydrolase domain-containing protein [Flavobacteriales bacterium]
MRSRYLLTATFFFFLLQLQAQKLDSLLHKTVPSFTGQVAIIKNDSLVFSYSAGWMNYPLQIPMNNDLLLESGELSTFFTREAIMDLVKSGKLKPEAPVADYLPSFPYKNITVNHLLNYTSGLPGNYLKLYHRYIYDDENIKVKDKVKNITNADILEILQKFQPALEFNPGEKKSINNINDIVLAGLVEILYFKNFEATIHEMTKSKYKELKIVASSDFETTPVPLKASGHRRVDSTHFSMEESLSDIGFKYNDATMGHHHVYASAESMARYFAANYHTIDQALLPYSGHEPGFNSTLAFYKGMVIVILSNTSDEQDTQNILKVLRAQF